VRRGHEVLRWAPTVAHATRVQRATGEPRLQVEDGYAIQLLHAPGYRRNIGWARVRFHRAMARRFRERARAMEAPDLIVVSHPTPEICVAASEFAAARGIPALIDVRDIWPEALVDRLPPLLRPLGSGAALYLDRLNRTAFASATGVVGISPGYLEWGLAHARRERGPRDAVVPMGYQEPELEPAEVEQGRAFVEGLDLRSDAPMAVFFGTMANQFELDLVVDAAAQRPDVEFVLCGDGEALPPLRRRADPLANVRLPGWVGQPEIAALLERADLGLAPYAPNARMSLPNKPFEYMSGGLPVVSSLRGELEALLDEHDLGVTYRAGSLSSLLDAVSRVVDRPEYRRTAGARARRIYEERYRGEDVYRGFSLHLEKVAAEATGVGADG
jgi:glycosyltransferase involved in cell wall biosynthesis